FSAARRLCLLAALPKPDFHSKLGRFLPLGFLQYLPTGEQGEQPAYAEYKNTEQRPACGVPNLPERGERIILGPPEAGVVGEVPGKGADAEGECQGKAEQSEQ